MSKREIPELETNGKTATYMELIIAYAKLHDFTRSIMKELDEKERENQRLREAAWYILGHAREGVKMMKFEIDHYDSFLSESQEGE